LPPARSRTLSARTLGAMAMVSSPCWFFLAIVVLDTVAAHTAPPPQHEILRYDVDMDADPGTRYAHVWSDFLRRRGIAAFQQTYAAWNLGLATVLPDLFGSPERAVANRGAWWSALQAAHPDTAAELQALSAVLLEANRSEPLFEVSTLAAAVSIYPILNIAAKNTTDTKPSACTSTLVRRADGTVLHGRSLDYEPRDPMALGTVVLDFRRPTRHGELAYRCLHPLVYPTALQWFTCIRPGAFSLSVNARGQGVNTEHNSSFDELLRRVRAPGALLLGELGEQAMQAKSYGEALAILASRPSVSSNYFILAGIQGQGAVVTRYGNISSADVWGLDSSPDLSDGQPPWLRVQTNVDHWVPFASGAYATHRRQNAVDLLSSMGHGAVDRDKLLGVYLTSRARAGSENRSSPEDTGVILRPTTIATLVLEPSALEEAELDPRYWRIWAKSPIIAPPASTMLGSHAGVVSLV